MKIIVYGLGKEYNEVRDILNILYDIVGLCDKEEKAFDNYISPENIENYSFDAVYIASEKYRDEIENDVIRYLNDAKVEFIGKSDLFGKNINPEERDIWVIDKLSKLDSGLVLLDAGAGEMQYAKYCKHLKYIAQDFGEYNPDNSDVGLQMERWIYPDSIVKCDIVNMPFPDDSIDVILCTEVFEHIKDPLAAIKEFNRVLKKNGKIILTAPFSCLVHMAPYFYNCGFSKYWYEENLKEYGFTIEEISSYGDYFSWIKQEIQRLPYIINKYTSYQLDGTDISVIIKMMHILNKYDEKYNKSNEVLCFGYRVIATKLCTV